MKCWRKRKFCTSWTNKIIAKIWIKLQVRIIFYRILHQIPHNFCIKHFLFRRTEMWENIHRKWQKFLLLECCLRFCVHAAYIRIDSSQDRLAHTRGVIWGVLGGGGATALPKSQVVPPSLNLPHTSPKPQEVTAAAFSLFLPKFKCIITLTSHIVIHCMFFFFFFFCD